MWFQPVDGKRTRALDQDDFMLTKHHCEDTRNFMASSGGCPAGSQNRLAKPGVSPRGIRSAYGDHVAEHADCTQGHDRKSVIEDESNDGLNTTITLHTANTKHTISTISTIKPSKHFLFSFIKLHEQKIAS